MTEFQIRIRSLLFRVVALVAFILLGAQLWNLQVVQGETYRELADANRFRLTQVSASRGVMYGQTRLRPGGGTPTGSGNPSGGTSPFFLPS